MDPYIAYFNISKRNTLIPIQIPRPVCKQDIWSYKNWAQYNWCLTNWCSYSNRRWYTPGGKCAGRDIKCST